MHTELQKQIHKNENQTDSKQKCGNVQPYLCQEK